VARDVSEIMRDRAKAIRISDPFEQYGCLVALEQEAVDGSKADYLMYGALIDSFRGYIQNAMDAIKAKGDDTLL
jgi:hypothetical protein